MDVLTFRRETHSACLNFWSITGSQRRSESKARSSALRREAQDSRDGRSSGESLGLTSWDEMTLNSFQRKGRADGSRTKRNQDKSEDGKAKDDDGTEATPQNKRHQRLPVPRVGPLSSSRRPSSSKNDEFHNTLHKHHSYILQSETPHSRQGTSIPPFYAPSLTYAPVNDSRATATYSPSGPQLPISQIWISSTTHSPRSTLIGPRLPLSRLLESTASFCARRPLRVSDAKTDWYENGNRHFNAGLR